MEIAAIGLALFAVSPQLTPEKARGLKEEIQLIQGGVVSPAQSVMPGDLLRVQLIDPVGLPEATFEGPARLYFAFDDPLAQSLATIEELPKDLAPFSAMGTQVVNGEVRFRVSALGEQMQLSLFVARGTPHGILVSPVVDVLISTMPPLPGLIDPARIAVFANSNQTQSMSVAAAYLEARNIPSQNLYVVSFNSSNPSRPSIRESDFLSVIQPAIDSLPSSIDLIALSWTLPYKVVADAPPAKVMSITSAFMLGTGPGNFVETVQGGCAFLPSFIPSPLYDIDERNYGEAGLPRPTMILGGDDTQKALELIDRGVLSDGTLPVFGGFLVAANPARSVPRTPDMQATISTYASNSMFDMEWFDVGGASHPIGQNLLLYQTGDFIVEDIGLNGFLPGAVADNLDSWGGNLEAPVQGHMNLMSWLNGGVTGSYGTVREPCAFADKFPRTSILTKRYFAGESLIEAYVKSVKYPQEGVFVGDPAACPYCR